MVEAGPISARSALRTHASRSSLVSRPPPPSTTFRSLGPSRSSGKLVRVAASHANAPGCGKLAPADGAGDVHTLGEEGMRVLRLRIFDTDDGRVHLAVDAGGEREGRPARIHQPRGRRSSDLHDRRRLTLDDGHQELSGEEGGDPRLGDPRMGGQTLGHCGRIQRQHRGAGRDAGRADQFLCGDPVGSDHGGGFQQQLLGRQPREHRLE